MTRPLRLGTRASALATTQSRLVADALRAATGRAVELVSVTTEGDVSRAALAVIGGTGVFVTALREALLDGRVDLAVHSLKDLPTRDCPGVVLAAVPRREDPRDVVVARGARRLADLPAGARIGTGSPRRRAQLESYRPELAVVPIRGNVDTRLRYVAEGSVDAVVLARAGLARLGRLDAVTETLDPSVMLPAPGQGALAVECRSSDAATLAVAAVLDDPWTRVTVAAERSLLAALEAGCSAPVGALAEVVDPGARQPELVLRAAVLAPDGSRTLRSQTTGTPADADALGRRLATELLDSGAAVLMGSPS